MKYLKHQYTYKFLWIFFATLLFYGCKQNPQVTIESISGKYLESIKKDQIIMEDGSVYDIPLTDSSYVYYLVRHAEKDTIPKNDPRLTQEGYDRASKLYDLLKGTRIDAIYSTMYMRTIETVNSLADAKGMKIMPYSPQGFKELHANLKENTDYKRIIISGHSNTTPVVANYLSDSNHFTASFDDSDYDNFIVVVENGQNDKTLIPLRYKP